jgi:hypothetical protein
MLTFIASIEAVKALAYASPDWQVHHSIKRISKLL